MTGSQNHEDIAETSTAVDVPNSMDPNEVSDGNDFDEFTTPQRTAKLNLIFSRIRENKKTLSSQLPDTSALI